MGFSSTQARRTDDTRRSQKKVRREKRGSSAKVVSFSSTSSSGGLSEYTLKIVKWGIEGRGSAVIVNAAGLDTLTLSLIRSDLWQNEDTRWQSNSSQAR